MTVLIHAIHSFSYHRFDRTNFQFWLQKPTSNHKYNEPIDLSVRLRLKGGMADRQNRVGSKFGGGGVSSTQNAERHRKERLRQLALESAIPIPIIIVILDHYRHYLNLNLTVRLIWNHWQNLWKMKKYFQLPKCIM